jgi:ADP-ribose pyrophosphatase
MRKSKLEELKSYIEELKTIKVLQSKKIYEGFLSINQIECLLNNNKTIKREEILKNGKSGSAAIVLPLIGKTDTLLVVQPRVLTSNTIGIELPAGYIEQGEDPEIAAIRELKEETGFIPKKIEKIASYYQDQGCSRALNHSFIGYDCKTVGAQSLDKDEYIRFFQCRYEEALELIDMGYINDANSILTLEKSKVYIKRR